MQLKINFTCTLTVLQIALGQFFENFENPRAINPFPALGPMHTAKVALPPLEKVKIAES